MLEKKYIKLNKTSNQDIANLLKIKIKTNVEDKNNSNKIIHLKISYVRRKKNIFLCIGGCSSRKQQLVSFTFEIMRQTNTFANSGKASLYNTVNQQYGSAWAQDGIRPEKFDLKKQTVPTYTQIVNSMNDFKKAERLIKNRIIKQKLDADGVPPETQFVKTTQFPIKASSSIKYPDHGLNVGPPIYRTNNMNYGSQIPVNDEMPNKFYPCNSSFTKGFPGGNYKFNGLNTVKTVSNVHNGLNDF